MSDSRRWLVAGLLLASALFSAARACAEINHYDIPKCIAARGFTSDSAYALRSYEIGVSPVRLQSTPHAGAIEIYHHCACTLQLGYPESCSSAYAFYLLGGVCSAIFPDGTGNVSTPVRYALSTIGARQSPGDPFPCRYLPGVSSAVGDECTASAVWEFIPGEDRGSRLVLTVDDVVLPVLQERFDVSAVSADEYIVSREGDAFHRPDNANVDGALVSLLEDTDQSGGCMVFYDQSELIRAVSCATYGTGRHVEIIFDNPVAITEAEFDAVLATAPTPSSPSPSPSPSPTIDITTGTEPSPSQGGQGDIDGAANDLLESPWGLLLAFHLGALLLARWDRI